MRDALSPHNPVDHQCMLLWELLRYLEGQRHGDYRPVQVADIQKSAFRGILMNESKLRYRPRRLHCHRSKGLNTGNHVINRLIWDIAVTRPLPVEFSPVPLDTH